MKSRVLQGRIAVFVLVLALLSLVALAQPAENPDIYESPPNITAIDGISLGTKEMIVKSIKPQELGVGEVRLDNVNIRVVGTEVSFVHETSQELLRNNVKKLKSQTGYQKLIDLLKGMQSGTHEGKEVKRRLKVYEISSIYENVQKRVFRTMVTIEPEGGTDSTVIQIVPADVAINITQFAFPGKVPVVIEKEPLALQWKPAPGENLTYLVKTLVVGDEKDIFIHVARRDGFFVNEEDEDSISEVESLARTIEKELESLGLGFTNHLVFFSISGLILLISVLAFVEMEHRNAFSPIKNFGRDARASVLIGGSNKKILDSYIRECIESGTDPEVVRLTLVRAGWNKKAVRYLIEKYL